jgi:hypothetical protein
MCTNFPDEQNVFILAATCHLTSRQVQKSPQYQYSGLLISTFNRLASASD